MESVIECVKGAILGACAATTVESILYPIDTIKTRQQSSQRRRTSWTTRGLYAGFMGNLIGALPASAIFMGVYQPSKENLLNTHSSPVAHTSAATMAALAASLVRVPTEVVKQRTQLCHFPSPRIALKEILRRQGARGLYAGFGSLVLRDVHFDVIQFFVYEETKLKWRGIVQRDLHSYENALIGGVSGAITGAVTTPFDAVKTRLMTEGLSGGIYNCAKRIVKQEGSKAFFKGVGPRALWLGFGGSIYFGVLENLRELQARLV